MVLPDRIELSTSPLPMECSTTELRQRAPDYRESAENGPYRAGRSLPQGQGSRKREERPVAPSWSLAKGAGSIKPGGPRPRASAGPIAGRFGSPFPRRAPANALIGLIMTSNSIISPGGVELDQIDAFELPFADIGG